jgi:hypothetical protein
VQQPQPESANARTITKSQTIAKLEAEIQHNRRRIARLQDRQTQLTHKLAEITEQQHHSSSSPNSGRKSKSRQSPAKLAQNHRTWLAFSIIALSIALICGTIGFAIVRLITVR